jgi:dihydroxyacetone kinase
MKVGPTLVGLTIAVSWLRAKNIAVRRVMAGTYMTSLNMPGFSLSLLLLPTSSDPYTPIEVLELLDAPAFAPGWPWTSASEPGILNVKVDDTAPEKRAEVDLARK